MPNLNTSQNGNPAPKAQGLTKPPITSTNKIPPAAPKDANDVRHKQNMLATALAASSVTGAKADLSRPAIEVISYTKRFGKFIAAENLSFKVGHGVIHGFIGPNGAGKTTTIKAMIGAYIPTSGQVLINGNKAGSVAANRLIGYIPERASFPKHLNSIGYLTAMGTLSGLKPRYARDRAAAILKSLGLDKHMRRKPIKFSSGMQKKILMAQALLTNPKILILDEPAANLDPTARKDLFDQLLALREQGKTILISSHILAELERIIDEVSFVYYGEIIDYGPIQKFVGKQSSVFIKADKNRELMAELTRRGYRVGGDYKTEIEVANVPSDEVQKLLELLTALKVNVISFRSNDLQSIYDRLVAEAIEKKAGKQGEIVGHFTKKHKSRTV